MVKIATRGDKIVYLYIRVSIGAVRFPVNKEISQNTLQGAICG
jgi:hypothetical protein